MFNNILQCLVSRGTIGITNCAAADRLRDREGAAGISDNAEGLGDNGAGIGDNSAEISDDAAGIVDITAKVIPMLNSVLNGDWSNSVPGRQFPKGINSTYSRK